jgi:hypothetical protein
LENDLEIKRVTFNRINKHFTLIREAISTLETVTGKNSPELRRISKAFDSLWLVDVVFTKEKWQQERKKLSKEQKIDMDNSNRSLMLKRTTYLLNTIKKVKKTHFRSYTATTSPIQDAEYLLFLANKYSFLQAAGIIISNYIASFFMELLTKENIKFKNDDILHLYENLRNKCMTPKLKSFLDKSYRRVENAHNVRNRSAHVDRAKLTRKEIEQAIELAKLLKEFK